MEKYLTVSALTKYIKTKFDKDPYLNKVFIQGELSNFKRHSTGHLYFALKDNGSVINCMMFKRDAAHLSFDPKEGDSVLLTGRISVYETRGNYQVYAEEMRLDGIGVLYEKLEALKKAFYAKGYFDQSHKKQLRKYPEHIAVLTASTGAAVQDIRTTLKKRYPLAKVTYISTLVQGAQAKDDIAKNIKQADALNPDVIIVGRGGGSIEDLWAFNEEVVVEAIYNCTSPVISAVGHETDTTLSDLVADFRAPTPTAAAVMATPDSKELKVMLKQVDLHLERYMQNHLKAKREKLNYLSNYYIFTNPNILVEQKLQKVDELDNRMKMIVNNQLNHHVKNYQYFENKINAQQLRTKLAFQHERVDNLKARMSRTLKYNISTYQQQLHHQIALLSSLSPSETLLRGYAIVRKDNKIINSVKALNETDTLSIQLSDGYVETKVMNLKK